MREAFGHWHAMAAQRALLTRVFTRMQEAWEGVGWHPEHHYEFDLMQRVMGAWRERAGEVVAKRTGAAREARRAAA